MALNSCLGWNFACRERSSHELNKAMIQKAQYLDLHTLQTRDKGERHVSEFTIMQFVRYME